MRKRLLIGVILLCTVGLFGTYGLYESYSAQDEPIISSGAATWPQYYNGTNFRNPRIDASTRAINTIDYAHHEIHDGGAYFLSGTSVMASGTTGAIVFMTPSTTKTAHMTMALSSTGAVRIHLIEKANVQMITGATIFNHDRNSANEAGVSAAHVVKIHPPGIGGSALWAGGVTLYDIAFGSSGQAQTTIGGQQSRESELIFKSGTTYMMYFLNNAGAVNNVSYHLNWYEHTPKDD